MAGSFWKQAGVWTITMGLLMAGWKAMAAPENALSNYLQREEPLCKWDLKEQRSADGMMIYDLWLRSQRWKFTTWTHQLTLVVPGDLKNPNDCLLFVTGGSNRDGQPRWSKPDDDTLAMIGGVAKGSGSPVAVLRQVPNQPLYGDRVEDDLISFTFDQYLRSHDPEWPLLFPMVKSAVKAMDAIQEFAQSELNLPIQKFVVSGGSKRGWTTWLTGASDPRVAAIAPMVIDVLNMGSQMAYQLEAWGRYSEMINDYTQLGLTNKLQDPSGKELTDMVDPYAYRDKITMPKLIFIGTNDPYWPVDAIKNYFDDLVGPKFIHYVPNAGHGLGDGKEAIQALAAYFTDTARGLPYPRIAWSTVTEKRKVHLTVKGSEGLVDAQLWSASSPDRDLRDDQWSSAALPIQGRRDPQVTAVVDLPQAGFRAFYVDLIYPSPIDGTYSFSTRMFLADEAGILERTMN